MILFFLLVGIETAAALSISASDQSATEGADLTFSPTLSSAASAPGKKIRYLTADGTATAGSDYTASSGVLDIATGQTSTSITVSIGSDTAKENDETFTIRFYEDLITDGDVESGSFSSYWSALGRASVVTTTQNAVDGGSGSSNKVVHINQNANIYQDLQTTTGTDYTLSFDTSRNQDAECAATVNLAVSVIDTTTSSTITSSSYALSNSSFSFTGQTIDFKATSSSTRVTFSTSDAANCGSIVDNISLYKSLTLQSPDASATGTIVNDDTIEASIAATTNASENNSGSVTNGQFTFTLDQTHSGAITLNYSVSGTASSGSDFTALADSITIPANTSSATLDISILEDASPEVTETITLTLTSADEGFVTIGNEDEATITITDDDVPVINLQATTNGQEYVTDAPVNGVITATLSATATEDIQFS